MNRFVVTSALLLIGEPGIGKTALFGYAADTAGGLLEEPATVRALAGYLARGLDCGAVSAQEVTALTGLDRADLDALGGISQVESRGAAHAGSHELEVFGTGLFFVGSSPTQNVVVTILCRQGYRVACWLLP